MSRKNVSAIIVAAGSGSRMGMDKMSALLCGKTVLEHTVEIFADNEYIKEIIIVAAKENIDKFREITAKIHNEIKVICGGKTRGESSLAGIKAATGEFTLIHDGARPLCTKENINSCIEAAFESGSAALGVAPKDSLKKVDDCFISSTIDRSSVVQIQTPQIFRKSSILEAYERYATPADTDDCAVIEKAGEKIRIVYGSYENIKLTTPEDMLLAESIIRKRNGVSEMPFRVGTGFDTHKLAEGRKLIIGGVEIPYEKGLLGHSDADVLIHAIIDALLGACALGNIGQHFPDNDNAYKDISSITLLNRTAEIIRNAGFKIGNIDSTIIVQKPKMAPYIEKMRENISGALKTDISAVSIKAKTNEQMGFTGRGEGIEARSTVLVYK